MTKFNTTAGKPPIIVSDEDYGRLTKLATAASDRFPTLPRNMLRAVSTRRMPIAHGPIRPPPVIGGLDA
ncbi:hypothetical protein Snov_0785 [Ancylobacter novellus DSM 506]|uniref:Uncharacterized protein n=1 Tax=Ancylobacter novellus (strain ATCC 8093 / DSM 506 / JCM 20403 / CCM 1077 / IAM 12100 / NBRC 12443 / NCIMB 10456) TaxID=639283 RepID=D7A5I9_ANCN5|nr:hypothetical protein [Ancylobacter novellus]ADH88113.1 hypothetical protein Snov_0785 [Ancylobacter novellus DSM 506]